MDSEQQKIDQRIRTLEYELKILKSEIQRALLDIQEQILTHYYPELRSGEDVPGESVKQAFEAIRQKKAALAPAEEESEEAGEGKPQVKQVSLEEIRARQAQAVEASAGNGELSHEQIAALSEWVAEAVNKIGAERTAALIKTSTQKGWLVKEVVSFLEKLVALHESDEEPAKVSVNQILEVVLALDKVLQRSADPEEALALIEEANLG
ncbi:MAG: hypothetical protein J7M05_12510 [Anaerolineae bacterium]|nr:hypothetical protein [Anaerolineae bacterium]